MAVSRFGVARFGRFSLQTMFVTVTVLSVLFGIRLHHYREKARAIEFIRQSGGIVGFGHPQSSRRSTFSEPQHGSIYRFLVGNSVEDEVSTLALYDHRMPGGCDDRFLAELAAKSQSLAYVAEIEFNGGAITNAGIKHLSAFRRLEYLDLSNTQVDDQCIDTLAAHRNLKAIRLIGTNVAVTSVEALKDRLPACKITR